MTQNNPNKVDHLNDPTTVCLHTESEMKQNYHSPVLKKPAVTRAKRLEQFLWREFYDEYIRSRQRVEAMRPCDPTTEYYDEFGKPTAENEGKSKYEIAGEELTNRYPLYSTAAITTWNPQGESTCTFKRVALITRPTYLQRGKFDD